jgi:uncharacterized protein YbjT (DUF2867 family)
MAAGNRTAWLAGATGLIGRELLARLQADACWQAVHVFGRRAVPAGPKTTTHVVDFAALPQKLPPADDVFVALGTTIKVAGSQAAFRAVDFDAVLAIARAGRTAGATRLAIVSALGADASSRVFYNRVKGEMEAAVAALGYTTVTLAQPSLLAGDRASLGQPERPGEVWATRLLAPVMGLVPKSVRPIAARDVAEALVAATAAGAPGVVRLSSAAMQGAATR